MDMKILGGKNLPPFWERFDRLQRTARKLGAMKFCPRGVFRFESYEAFEEWKRNQVMNHRAPRKEAT